MTPGLRATVLERRGRGGGTPSEISLIILATVLDGTGESLSRVACRTGARSAGGSHSPSYDDLFIAGAGAARLELAPGCGHFCLRLFKWISAGFQFAILRMRKFGESVKKRHH